MVVYTFTLIVVVFLAILADKYKKNSKPQLLFTILIIVVLTLLSGLRYKVGTDYWNYEDIYFLTSTKDIFDVLKGDEPLFHILVWLSSRVIYEPQIMFFIVALLTISLIVLGIRKYSNNFPLSIFLYLATFSYFSAMNGMRQWLAVSILFYFFDAILENKRWKFLIVVFIASMIHNSALFILPIYFIIHKKHTLKFIIATIIVAGVFFFFYPYIENILANVLGRYGDYLTATSGYGAEGVKLIRVIIPIVIYSTSFFFLKKYIKDNKINILLNLMLISVLLAGLGLYSKTFFRIITYFSIYEILIIPSFFAKVKKREKLLFGFMLIVSFYLYVSVLWHVDSNVLPYQTIFQK